MTPRITIFDTTLRDGEQSPGIALQPHEKAEIAEQLERLGVDVIEAGFAISSPGDFEGIRAVARVARNATVASLARTSRDDVDAAVEALADAHRTRLHIFIATSPIHMERKLRLEPAEVLEQARAAVAYAHGRVDEVEFSAEDATRSDPQFLAEVCRAAIEAGATTVNLPDTVGYCLPAEYAAFLRRGAGPVPRARLGDSLRPLPRRPRARDREHARGRRPPERGRSSAPSTGSASGRATQRSRRS